MSPLPGAGSATAIERLRPWSPALPEPARRCGRLAHRV